MRSPAGDELIVYHRWEQPPGAFLLSGERQIGIDLVRFDEHGGVKPVSMTDGAASLHFGDKR